VWVGNNGKTKLAITECKNETRTRDIEYTVCVPQTRTRTDQVTTYKNVSSEKVESYTVMVPHEVEKEVQVRVCKMVPQQVSAQGCGDRAPSSRCSGRARRFLARR